MESERRQTPRYPFFAAAELTESTSGARLKAYTSDLGPNGCYLGTINPLPQGTVISIQITYQGQVFAAGGVVAHAQANMGMGVKFIALESGCSALLESWLRQVNPVEEGTSDSSSLFLELVALIKKCHATSGSRTKQRKWIED
jgi:hypothetical protein